jgi:hypothetical protein
MEENGDDSVAALRGRLSAAHSIGDPGAFLRAYYRKILTMGQMRA